MSRCPCLERRRSRTQLRPKHRSPAIQLGARIKMNRHARGPSRMPERQRGAHRPSELAGDATELATAERADERQGATGALVGFRRLRPLVAVGPLEDLEVLQLLDRVCWMGVPLAAATKIRAANIPEGLLWLWRKPAAAWRRWERVGAPGHVRRGLPLPQLHSVL